MDDQTLAVACPSCAQQPTQECRWLEFNRLHPRFHASRIEAGAMLAGLDGDASPITDEMIDRTGLV